MSVPRPLFIFILLFDILTYIIFGGSEVAIFTSDPCKMQCFGKPHTLCNINKTNAGCPQKTSSISDSQRQEMKNMLIMGHNGLRNRIAELSMMVANMVEMVWHNELALMADNYISECRPYVTDPCAELPQNATNHEGHTHFSDTGEHTYHEVAQNRYLQKRIHYPNLLIENALRTWYLEKDAMSAPTIEFNFVLQSEVGHLEKDNNFTHLASPLSTHFGCGFNRLTPGYLLVCNYHPFRRRKNVQVDFLRGKPGSMCPVTRPLRNSRGSLTNLCFGDVKYSWRHPQECKI